MKKLVAVTTTILIILIAVLGVFMIKGHGSDSSTAKSTLSDRKESLSDKEDTKAAEASKDSDADWVYDGELLRMNKQMKTITYEGRDFKVKFTNPFYEEGSDNYISVIFYDKVHGYLLKSLGEGTDSAFYEAYKTEDGCETWNKCTADVWFDLNGSNHLEMISENEIVYVCSVVNENLGTNETTISYSADGGDSWQAFKSNSGGDSEAIKAIIDKMTLEQKVAQLFVVSPETLTGVDSVQYAGDMTYQALQDYPVGGIVFAKDNIDSSSQFGTMTDNLQSYSEEISGLPLFLAAAEEGGSASVLGNNDNLDEYYENSYSDDDSDYSSSSANSVHSGAPSMSEIGRKDDSTNAYEAGKSIGSLMSAYGLNLDLAPVADVLSGNSTGIGNRTFGTDAQTVSDMALEVIRGIQEEDVNAAMKYFPGYGAASSNMSGFPVINSSLDELKKKEFLPYSNAIAQGMDFVMVGHISVPNVTGDDTPASLSEKMISEVLRKDLGFKGIVMTDYLNDKTIVKNYGAADAAVKAIQAGADLLLEPDDLEAAYEGVLKAVKKGDITEDRLDESIYRILRVKLSMQDESSDTTESESVSDY
ncbi:MAG: glycoside hydrolase family 3 N-terminal domain-containing protein [Coprococcus sp.]|uniref:glycoside hydrolase family 3 N-terminal domain-containing protein n=1 Tax=Coprococcus catus TaxID=116085 RepID=UPI001C0152CF|nr:glycoside hydrolase family 3 N-terminal domain-containing protein [Coprococcus catus]